MKNISNSFSRFTLAMCALVAVGILISSCKKEEPVVEEPDTSDYLANTPNSFSAIVDGTIFNETLLESSNTNGRITLTASKNSGTEFIRIYFPTNIEKGTYTLDGPSSLYRGFYVASPTPGDQYSTKTSNGSIVTITGHDTNNDVIIGEFNFKPFSDTNTVAPIESVNITGGSFAINY